MDKKRIILVRSRAIDTAILKIADTLNNNGYIVKLLLWDRQRNCNYDKKYTIAYFRLKAPYDKYSIILYLPIWWLYVMYYLLFNKEDIIHAADLDTLLPAIIIKLIKNIKLYYIIYDFYGNNILFKPLRKFISWLERNAIKNVDHLFIVDESRIEEIGTVKDIVKDIDIIYNSPSDNNIDINKNLSQERLRIFYGGVISKVRGIEDMLEAVTDIENVILIVAGIGDNKIINKIIQNKKIQYLGWLKNYEDILKLTYESDIIFRFSDPNLPKTKYESPNKLFEAMMCAKPIIVSDLSSMAMKVRQENCGIIIQYGNIEDIRKAVFKLLDPNYRKTLGTNGRNAYEKKYSWDIMEKRILNVYNKI
jgi:glycosyltransferase involved in cell wall biosynthesis